MVLVDRVSRFGERGTGRWRAPVEREGERAEQQDVVEAGEVLVVVSRPAARRWAVKELTERQVKLSLAGSITTRPTPPRPLFTVLATVVEFASDLIRTRTREGMKDAKAKRCP